MIVVNLRAVMDAYRRKHGKRLTYGVLCKAAEALAGDVTLSMSALNSIANDERYNPTLRTINLLCRLTDSRPETLLQYTEDDPALTHPLDLDELKLRRTRLRRRPNPTKKKPAKRKSDKKA